MKFQMPGIKEEKAGEDIGTGHKLSMKLQGLAHMLLNKKKINCMLINRQTTFLKGNIKTI